MASTVKTNLMAKYDFLIAVSKSSDLTGEVNGHHVHIKIKKNEVVRVVVDGEATDHEDVNAIIDDLINNNEETEMKEDAIVETKAAVVEMMETMKNDEVEMVESGVEGAEEVSKTSEINMEAGMNVVTVEKVQDVDMQIVRSGNNPAWVDILTEKANDSQFLRDGDRVHLHVVTSAEEVDGVRVPKAKWMTLRIQDSAGVEIATAGSKSKLNFAASGITEQWLSTVDDHIQLAYSNMEEKIMAQTRRAANQKVVAERPVLNEKWILLLEEKASGASKNLQEGHTIRFRPAQAHGHVRYLMVDIYNEDDVKIATAAQNRRISLAAKGITQVWLDAVDEAVALAYENRGKGGGSNGVQIDQDYIDRLSEKATEICNEKGLLQEGHHIVIRGQQSHQKFVTAHVDIHDEVGKIATAGQKHRVGFAVGGPDDKWIARLTDAVEAAYNKLTDAVDADGNPVRRSGGNKVVTDEWIQHLEERANEMLADTLRDGHYAQLKVRTSREQPVHACLVLLDEKGNRIGSGTDKNKIYFAAKGIDQDWEDSVRTAAEYAYVRLDSASTPKTTTGKRPVVVKVEGGKVLDAAGSVSSVLEALKKAKDAE